MKRIERPATPAERRIAELQTRGVLIPPESEPVRLCGTIARRRGALERFLEERDS